MKTTAMLGLCILTVYCFGFGGANHGDDFGVVGGGLCTHKTVFFDCGENPVYPNQDCMPEHVVPAYPGLTNDAMPGNNVPCYLINCSNWDDHYVTNSDPNCTHNIEPGGGGIAE